MHKNPNSAFCAREGETELNYKAAQVLTQENRKVLHPILLLLGAQSSMFVRRTYFGLFDEL